jgi:hypothetical protein
VRSTQLGAEPVLSRQVRIQRLECLRHSPSPAASRSRSSKVPTVWDTVRAVPASTRTVMRVRGEVGGGAASPSTPA